MNKKIIQDILSKPPQCLTTKFDQKIRIRVANNDYKRGFVKTKEAYQNITSKNYKEAIYDLERAIFFFQKALVRAHKININVDDWEKNLRSIEIVYKNIKEQVVN